MTVRSIKKLTQANSPWLYTLEPFPLDKDGIIYVRQSSIVQMQKNIHSFEMQTDKFLEYFRNMGCTGNIEIIADDEAMSGTLDIHKLPGMSRMMQLIVEEGGKRIGWIAAVHVNRLTRDPWLIKPAHLMKTCHDHDVWIATLRMNFNFREPSGYSQRVFMMEAEESARHLEWMKLVLGGGKITASANGYYDGRPVAPGYLVDRSDPERKKYIRYAPFASQTLWLYERLCELDFNFYHLCQEVAAIPYVYPRLEEGMKVRLAIKPIKEGMYEGCYKPSRGGLLSILTNPAYIGWWIPLQGDVIINNHKPIVPEELFWMAHRRLSSYDLNGNRQKPERVTRYGTVEGLLKKVLTSDQGNVCYTGTFSEFGTVYRFGKKIDGLVLDEQFTVSISTIDGEFLNKFFEHLRKWQGYEDWSERLEQKVRKEEARKHQINGLIAQAQERWDYNMATFKDPSIPKTPRMKQELANECAGLEGKIAQWQQDLQTIDDPELADEQTQYEIYTLLPDLMDYWDDLSFATRLRFVNALTRRVVLNHVSPNWLKMEIHWKRADWGIDIGHIRRHSYHENWRQEEDAIIQTSYLTIDPKNLLEQLPDRSWEAIRHRALRLGLQRVRKIRGERGITIYRHISLQDSDYARKEGFDPTRKDAVWSATGVLKKDTNRR